MIDEPPIIAILGAAGLIGRALAEDLALRDYPVLTIARRPAPGQAGFPNLLSVAAPVVSLDTAALAGLFERHGVGIVINCLGLLQDGGGDSTDDVHRGFAERLTCALARLPQPALLIQLSVPGEAAADRTEFSRTKRAADRVIVESGLPYAILRPGFVLAPGAYGGSALLRGLAALPFDLSARESARPFAATSASDIAATVAFLAEGWRAGRQDWHVVWDVMEQQPVDVGQVVAALRARFGGPAPFLRLPGWLMALGARSGDIAGRLGWKPPIRTTALRELRRGVAGDPRSWIAATGIEPASLARMLARLPSNVQERWFGRLYLAKAALLAGLALFWLASGLVALGPGYRRAVTILVGHGIAPGLATAVNIVTSLCDIAIGLAIAWRRSCQAGLLAGLVLAAGYLLASILTTPELWLDPLGPLVKILPVLLAMGTALALLEDR